MNLHLFNANGALLSLAWGNAPGFTWTEDPSALKARVINAMSSLQKRMELTIRTAYGEDPEQVIALLVKTAAAHPDVTKDPPPDAVLKQFDENALVFVLGFTTEDVARSPFVQSDVAVAVNAALRDAGIEIPVPQRIVHLEQNDATKHSLGQHRA